jgi:nitrate reductase / nitrite oxidoreductase, alpha subunit
MTSDVNHNDIAFACNSWMEFTYPEMTATVSNPWVQIWKGGIRPLYDTRNDAGYVRGRGGKLTEMTGDKRMRTLPVCLSKPSGCVRAAHARCKLHLLRLQRRRDAEVGKGLDGHGADLSAPSVLGRDQRVKPHVDPHGRYETYRVEPEAIEYGENFIVHREGPEATPYLPNAIFTSNPYVRPDDYGIPITAQHHDDKTVRNIKLPWQEIKRHSNPLWEKGYQFYCVTPKTRHRVHSQWSVNDWVQIYESNFGDPYRMDKRTPGVGEHQLHINPQAAKDRGINDGDYVYVDGNPVDRPYRGWKPSDPYYKVARLMIRAKYNPSYPYHVTMAKHAPYVSTPKSVKGHETRPDGTRHRG